MDREIKFPATHLAHWVTGHVPCCEEHANSIVQLGKFMGSVVAVSLNDDPNLECKNCIIENKDKN